MARQPHLIMFDADHIKDFVFATGRLKEIRGGSRLVRDATDGKNIERELGLTSEQVIFAEGGSGLLKAASGEKANDICRRLANHYTTTTNGVTLTAVAAPLDGGFRETVQRAARALRLKKESPRPPHQHPQTPFSRPCESCGARPAARFYDRSVHLCHVCFGKRNRADQLRREEAAGDFLYLNDMDWGRQFFEITPEDTRSQWQVARVPQQLDELARLSRPDNYLGFVYADGNGLGRRIQQQESEAAYRQFSRRVSYSLRAALWLTLRFHFPEPRRGPTAYYAPFELIALGGDDVILVTVADQAVPLACTLGRLFQHISAALAGLPESELSLETALNSGRAVEDHLDKPPDGEDVLTLSSGVVIAHPGQPILKLEQQARQLLRNAKSKHGEQAALDYHVVSSPVLRNVEDIRREEYTLDDRLHLTRRPMHLDTVETVLEYIVKFKQDGEAAAVPRNKLHSLYQALFSGQQEAEFEAFFLLARLGVEQKRKVLAFFKVFGIEFRPSEGGASLPWGIDQDNETSTVFGDLMDLYEFTHDGVLPGRRHRAITDTETRPEEDGNGATQN